MGKGGSVMDMEAPVSSLPPKGRPITPLWSWTVFDEVAQFPQLWHAPLGFASPLFALTFSCFICGYGFSSGPSLIPDAHSTDSS